jgi:hypothetical protein
VLSFAYFSLHEQRKVGRAKARKPLFFALPNESHHGLGLFDLRDQYQHEHHL